MLSSSGSAAQRFFVRVCHQDWSHAAIVIASDDDVPHRLLHLQLFSEACPSAGNYVLCSKNENPEPVAAQGFIVIV
jgi:hypothetical protein